MKMDFMTGLWLFALIVNLIAACITWKKKRRYFWHTLAVLAGILCFLASALFPALSWAAPIGAVIFIVQAVTWFAWRGPDEAADLERQSR